MRLLRPVLSTILVLTACTPSQEPVHVPLAVVLDASAVSKSTTDLGWTVELSSARIAAADLRFTIQGEMHGATASLGRWFGDLVIARAWAHPGHYAGGDVTGELLGEFVLDWLGDDGATLGTADLLVGDYNGMNLDFRAATESDGLAADDPLLGHTAHFVGVARSGDVALEFTAVVDLDAGAQLIGAPFEATIDADTTAPIELQLVPTDPEEGTSLFDGIDFAALEPGDDGIAAIVPGDVAHNLLRRTLQSHVHYNATPK
jgi:hypothetical protein